MGWWRRKDDQIKEVTAESQMLLGQMSEAAEAVRRASRDALDAAAKLKAAALKRIQEEATGGTKHREPDPPGRPTHRPAQ